MSNMDIDAYIVTGSDPHGSQYPLPSWHAREWISGFTGSTGMLVITQVAAGLWTDFRYWTQASEELAGRGIALHREGDVGVLPIHEWLTKELTHGARVGVDGRTLSGKTATEWEERFRDSSITLLMDVDLISGIWPGRPKRSSSPVYELSDVEAGESRSSRLKRLHQWLKNSNADTWVCVALDSLSWLLNVRGDDVLYNPVVAGFFVYSPQSAIWYTDEKRLSQPLIKSLNADGVHTAPYEDFFCGIEALPSSSQILVDMETITQGAFSHIPSHVTIRTGKDPVLWMKARKNPTEIQRTRIAMEKDGVAVVRFLMDLETKINSIDELEAASLLRARRSEISGFMSESFATIAAFGPHGAICHYQASPQSALSLESGANLFLIDSGAQWEEGTTDITRTVILGEATQRQKSDYTLALKGHIALARAKFPHGTRGYQLDTLARVALWEAGIDFGHGAGHGVGHRLSVHEGPQKFSPAPVDVAIDPGMIISNEPGVYREGEWGIRIENLLLCREDYTNQFGTFLFFETLTLAPYDRKLIAIELLSKEEITWIDNYHAELYRRLEPMLESMEISWLKNRTSALQ